MTDRAEVKTHIDEIGRYGAAVFAVTAEEFYSAGFASGDLVCVEIGEKSFEVPVGTAYSDVDNGKMILLKIEFEKRMLLSVNNENGFAAKQGLNVGDRVTVRMKEKGGYLSEYERRKLVMGTDRAGYPSDEAFCNFRAVSAGKMKNSFLYRGFSPINPMENRSALTDALLAKTDVKTVINLDGEKEEDRRRYAGYEQSHYAKLNIIPLKTGFSAADPSFPGNMKELIGILTKEEGPFYIHCRFGRDRTGLLCMALEALCEADLGEIMEDYMLSYENIHRLEKYSDRWNLQLEKKAFRAFEELTGVYPDRNLSGKETEALMRETVIGRCRVTEEELNLWKEKFCG